MNAIQETITELKEFVTTRAAGDAEMPANERKYQAQAVKDVLGAEALKPNLIRELVDEYAEGVASHLPNKQTAT